MKNGAEIEMDFWQLYISAGHLWLPATAQTWQVLSPQEVLSARQPCVITLPPFTLVSLLHSGKNIASDSVLPLNGERHLWRTQWLPECRSTAPSDQNAVIE